MKKNSSVSFLDDIRLGIRNLVLMVIDLKQPFDSNISQYPSLPFH